MSRLLVVLAVALVMLCSSALPAFQVSAPSAPPAAETLDALQKFNLTFKENYAWQRKREIAAIPTLVWAIGDNLVLYREVGGKSERTEVKVIPKIYHTLKIFAHVPLTVQITLEGDTDRELTGETLEKAKALLVQIQGLKPTIDSYELKRPTSLRQLAMVEASITLLAKAIEDRKISHADLTGFARRMRVGVMANVAEAGRAQIDAMHAQMKAWRTQMSPAEWKNLKVAVSGPSMPRIGNLTTQYFAKLLKEKGEGRRIIYTEWAWAEDTMADRIGTDWLDTKIAVAFFGDDRRMHRDLLSDAATAILKNYPLE